MEAVPDKVLVKIFSYLVVKDLISCSGVSKKWKAIADSQDLWKRLLEKDLPSEVATVSDLNYKGAYKATWGSILNWRRGRFEKFAIDGSSDVGSGTVGNGAVLVVLKTSGVLSTHNWITNDRQEIRQFEDTRISGMQCFGDFVAVSVKSLNTDYIVLYEWQLKELKPVYFLYPGVDGAIQTNTPNVPRSFECFSLGGIICATVRGVTLSFWCYKKRKNIFKTRLLELVNFIKCTEWSVFTSGSQVVERNFSGDVIHVFNFSGAMSISENQDFSACCNEETAVIWKKDGESSNLILNCRKYLLHPKLPLSISHEISAGGMYNPRAKIVGRELTDYSVIWTIQISGLPAPIDQYHVMVLTDKESFIIGWQKGYIFSKFEHIDFLNCISSKLCASNDFVYSFIPPSCS